MGIGRYKWGNPRYTTVIDNGPPDKRLDVTILGDGYAVHEMEMFRDDVDTVIQAFHEIEPMKSYIRHFNFHRVDVISQQSGVDDRWSNPPIKRKSALGAHFSFLNERRLVGWDWRVKQVAMRSGAPHDALLVIVNTPRRGGATRFWMTVGYASRNSSDFPRIMIHEAGHAIGKLMDEYDYSLPAIPLLAGRSLPEIMPFANVTTRGVRPKWQEWLEPGIQCPTPVDDTAPHERIGAFEGAGYCKFGVYKPTQDCMMRRHSQPFCPICQEQWIKRIYRRTAIADRFTPESSVSVRTDEEIVLGAEVVRPTAEIQTTYRVRTAEGPWTVAQGTTQYAPFHLQFPTPGRRYVECTLEDRTPRVRKQVIRDAIRMRFEWQIDVV